MNTISRNYSPEEISQHQTLGALLSRLKRTVEETYSRYEKVVAEITSVVTVKKGVRVELADYTESSGTRAKISAFIYTNVKHSFENQSGSELKDGLKVLVDLKISYSEEYGLSGNIRSIDPKYTIGDLAIMVKAMKDELSKKEIIDLNRNLPQPKDFFSVAVISPESSAGLEDFRSKLTGIPKSVCKFEERHCVFQSNKAGSNIASQIKHLNSCGENFDVIIITRGGGAKSDLYYLNDLQLAETVCLSKIPIFSAVGHDRDKTIIDEVANQDFQTPSLVASHIREVIILRATELQDTFLSIRQIADRNIENMGSNWILAWTRLSDTVSKKVHDFQQETFESYSSIRESSLSGLAENKLALNKTYNQAVSLGQSAFSDSCEDIHQSVRDITSLARDGIVKNDLFITKSHNQIVSGGQALLVNEYEEVNELNRSIVGLAENRLSCMEANANEYMQAITSSSHQLKKSVEERRKNDIKDRKKNLFIAMLLVLVSALIILFFIQNG